MLADVDADRVHKGKRIQQVVRDGWAKPLARRPRVTHPNAQLHARSRSHHRGQVAMLAHQLGHPLPKAVTVEMWNWEKLWK